MKKFLVLFCLLLTAIAGAVYFAGFNNVKENVKAIFVEEKKRDEIIVPPPPPPSTEKRVALVIGNADYPGDDNDLPNDINDAKDMAEALKKLGFEVMFASDANKEEMIDSLSKFGEKLENGVVGLFYFSGHGVELDGEQYIVPTDAKLKTQDYLDSEAISVKKILKKMGENKSQFNFLILDSCRNNSIPKAWGIKGSLDISFTRDNAPNPSGVLIESATASGDFSSAAGERNSVYTKHLLHYLNTEPTLEVGLLFRRVRAAVEEATNSKQTPWETGAIKGEFYFVSPIAQKIKQEPEPYVAPLETQQSFEPAPVKPAQDDTLTRLQVMAKERDRVEIQKDFFNTDYFKKNCPKEFTFWKQSAEQGQVIAQSLLGGCYYHGEGIAKDQPEAAKWYRKAAEQGYPPGQDSLGLSYEQGDGVAEDMAQAMTLYRKAAEQGYPPAQVRIGDMYRDGEGVAKDGVEAAKWYRKAAEQGDFTAQIKLKDLSK